MKPVRKRMPKMRNMVFSGTVYIYNANNMAINNDRIYEVSGVNFVHVHRLCTPNRR